METIKDLWASLVAYANERSTNPLTSAFVLTWAAWNYKFFVLLFEDVPSAEKFAAIDKLYPRPETYYGSGLLYPALTALFYVFVYPYITGWVVTFYRSRQVEIANKIRQVEGERVRTVDEVARLVRSHENKLAGMDADVKAARDEAVELRNALSAAEAENKVLQDAEAAVSRLSKDSLKASRSADPIRTEKKVATEVTGKTIFDEILEPDNDATDLSTSASIGEFDPVSTSMPKRVRPRKESEYLERVLPFVETKERSVRGIDELKSQKLFSLRELRVLHYLLTVPGPLHNITEVKEFFALTDQHMTTILNKLEILGMVKVEGSFVSSTSHGRTVFLELKGRGEVPDDLL